LSAEPDAYLVVALSGRALAAAARRSGRRAVVADLFGDADTRALADAIRVVEGDLDDGFDEAALVQAAEELAPAASPPRQGLVYGSGLESRPDLLRRLAQGRRLCGNSPETVARTKDPQYFFGLLDRLGIPHPAVSFAAPADARGWLLKHSGGAGGGHVMPAGAGAGAKAGRYFQRRAPGRPIGVSFLANGERALVLGCSEQWIAPQADTESFRFGGLLQPAGLDRRVAREILPLLDALVCALGLVGLNSLDMMVEEESMAVLEINPRPGANLDIFDDGDPAGLFGLHVDACAGHLPQRRSGPKTVTAMSVVYADRARQVPVDLVWPAWVADRPLPGARIAEGWPICTVLAAEPSADAARRTITERVDHVLAALPAAETTIDIESAGGRPETQSYRGEARHAR